MPTLVRGYPTMTPDERAVSTQVESIMEDRAEWFRELWDDNNKRVNRRLMFLFVAVFLALGFLALRAENGDRQIEADRYAACTERLAQVNTFNQGSGRDVIVRIVTAANPGMSEADRAELIAALVTQIQLPVPRCAES